jgi:hypothetical protein
VGSSVSSGGSYGARRRNKSKKGRQATLLKEDTDDDVLDVSGDSMDDNVVVVEKSAKKRKLARSGDVRLKQGRKNVKKREPTPTSVAPLKLTCEIELSPTTLAAIAEHVEALFLQKMMAAQLPDH